jgi:hypothetical protein
MPPFLYRCPTTGYRVQGFIAEELPADTYEAVACTACRRVHLVNPTTGGRSALPIVSAGAMMRARSP